MQNGILIEPVINNEPHGYIIQAQSFDFSLKITNMSSFPYKEFGITHVILNSESVQNLGDNFNGKSFVAKAMNPGESEIISIGKNGQFIRGLVQIQANIDKKDNTSINLLQKNPFTKELSNLNSGNQWVDFIYAKSSAEAIQEETTKILIRLTWVTAILTFLSVVLFVFQLLSQS